MARQLQEIYVTGYPKIDLYLQRIALRLDELEGLNPDRDGLIEIEADKDIVGRTPWEIDSGEIANSEISSSNISGGTVDKTSITYGTVLGATISGGTINNTPIGNTTPNTGKFGGVTNHAEFESDGTLVLNGNATGWDDMRVSLSNAKVPASNAPDFAQVRDDGAGSVGVFSYKFADGEYVFLQTQMSHRWKLGSTIWPHIHWTCTSNVDPADNWGCGMEYIWTDINEAAAANTTVIEKDISTGVNKQMTHQITNLSDTGIDGTGKGLSSILLIRLYRYAAASDNYADDIVITDFDLHYEIDTPAGSREIVTK